MSQIHPTHRRCAHHGVIEYPAAHRRILLSVCSNARATDLKRTRTGLRRTISPISTALSSIQLWSCSGGNVIVIDPVSEPKTSPWER